MTADQERDWVLSGGAVVEVPHDEDYENDAGEHHPQPENEIKDKEAA